MSEHKGRTFIVLEEYDKQELQQRLDELEQYNVQSHTTVTRDITHGQKVLHTVILKHKFK